MSSFAAFDTKNLASVTSDNFHSWSKNNFYRTSYGTHYTNLPEQPKNVAMPGYAGFVPFMKSSNLYGKGYSPITRTAFANQNLGVDKYHMSSTGYNFAPKVHVDPTKKAMSHKYGSQTIQKFHPCQDGERWESQNQSTFKHPKSFVSPTYRETSKTLETSQAATKHSGFQQNHLAFDGMGSKPNQILNGDLIRTEYRIQLNCEKPFHRDTTHFKLRKLKKNEQNYKHT